MPSKIVEIPSIKEPIQPAPGFAKKALADYKLDACGLCQYGCSYCSSNHGNYLRINRQKFADRTEEQLGQRVLPLEDPELMFRWPDYLERLESQLDRLPPDFGAGQTLVYSMQTDGFSPHLVAEGITRRSLELLLAKTQFRIRVLTKNDVVGMQPWVKFFAAHRHRFVVGLSIGTLDEDWARRVERLTPKPWARAYALHKLQDARVPTFGMICPTFPHVLEGDHLEHLVDQIRPAVVEHVWAEPFNDRANWELVRERVPRDGVDHRWLTDVYENKQRGTWSRYATDLYLRLARKAKQDGWIDRLRFLLYEDNITNQDAPRFGRLEGVLLQTKPAEDGRSRNPAVATRQEALT